MRTRFLTKIMLGWVLAQMALSARGYDFMVGGLAYNINPDGVTVTLTCEQRPDSLNGYRAYSRLGGELTVSDIVRHNGQDYFVTAIDENAFCGCSAIRGIVSLPLTIEKIGADAFVGCHFDGVNITDIASWCAIDFGNAAANPLNAADSYPGHFLINGKRVFALTVPASVEEIKPYAFYGLKAFSLTIEDGVKRIGQSAFENFQATARWLSLPPSIEAVGQSAFRNSTFRYIGQQGEAPIQAAEDAFEGCAAPSKVGEIEWDSCHVNTVVYRGYVVEANSALGGGLYPNDSELQNYNCDGWGTLEYESYPMLDIDENALIIIKLARKDSIDYLSQSLCEWLPPMLVTSRLKWQSSNPLVASVDEFGMVTGHADGFATIIVSDGAGLYAEISVAVSSSNRIRLSTRSLNIEQGSEALINADIGSAQHTLTFKTNHPEVARVVPVSSSYSLMTDTLAPAYQKSNYRYELYGRFKALRDSAGNLYTNNNVTPAFRVGAQDVHLLYDKYPVQKWAVCVDVRVRRTSTLSLLYYVRPEFYDDGRIVQFAFDSCAQGAENYYNAFPAIKNLVDALVQTRFLVMPQPKSPKSRYDSYQNYYLFSVDNANDYIWFREGPELKPYYRVEALQPGQATITFRYDNYDYPYAECHVTVTQPRLAGDVNGDGVVDVDDLNIVINIMLRNATLQAWPAADLDSNGVVDVDDLNRIINIMIHKE